MTSKANAFADLMKQAKGQGIAESDKAEQNDRPLKPRAKGKREHTDYGKIGVYIRTETITEVKTRLLRQRKDLSGLVQELLDRWLVENPQ
jgi:hypothetical protein